MGRLTADHGQSRNRGAPETYGLDASETMVEVAARLLMILLHFGSLKTVRRIVVGTQSWAESLPESDVDRLMTEFEAITEARGRAPDAVFAVAALLQRWRDTAEATPMVDGAHGTASTSSRQDTSPC
ncbi:hypothetical protein [Micromonospora sp. HM5-17]|jgi:hypothetical protein|uniref:hypothetical protein n=1 Tax=Micromonospora sp. HM5-17 TaxID=2487710 RepID=UPI000F4963BC|nr:hypothetical protein [Micromonospora sp. HM5-17]ROT31796.1 hypothetical protein EF879_15600 [Micromonospora sp. HM5-17]